MKIIRCRDILNLLSDFYDNELEEEIENLFREHIEECKNCLSLLHNFEKTLELFHSFEPIKLEPQKKREFHRWLHIEIKKITIKKYKKYER